jgi:hypothetical protein
MWLPVGYVGTYAGLVWMPRSAQRGRSSSSISIADKARCFLLGDGTPSMPCGLPELGQAMRRFS